jgi:hypothetical protein
MHNLMLCWKFQAGGVLIGDQHLEKVERVKALIVVSCVVISMLCSGTSC